MSSRSVQSTLSLAVLGLVAQEPLTGYALRKVFTTTPMGHFSASPGAIYPALRRMEREGLIRGSIEKANTLRPRQVFKVTEKGRKALAGRLLSPITREDVAQRMDELTLRFAFMGDVLGKKESLRYLEQLVSRINEYIPVLLKHLEAQRKGGRLTGAYALEHGIAHYVATVKWARRVIRDLEGRRLPRGRAGFSFQAGGLK